MIISIMNLCVVCVCLLLLLLLFESTDADRTNDTSIAYSSSPTSLFFSYSARPKPNRQQQQQYGFSTSPTGVPAWSTFLEFITTTEKHQTRTWAESSTAPAARHEKSPDKLIKRLASNLTASASSSPKLHEILILVHEDSLKHAHCTFSNSNEFQQNGGSRKAHSSSSHHHHQQQRQHVHHRQNFEYYLCNYLNDMVLLKASNHLKDRSLCKYDNKKATTLTDDCVMNNDDHYSSIYADHFRLVSLKINSSHANPDNVNRLYQQIKRVYFDKKPKSSGAQELERVLRSIFLIADSRFISLFSLAFKQFNLPLIALDSQKIASSYDVSSHLVGNFLKKLNQPPAAERAQASAGASLSYLNPNFEAFISVVDYFRSYYRLENVHFYSLNTNENRLINFYKSRYGFIKTAENIQLLIKNMLVLNQTLGQSRMVSRRSGGAQITESFMLTKEFFNTNDLVLIKSDVSTLEKILSMHANLKTKYFSHKLANISLYRYLIWIPDHRGSHADPSASERLIMSIIKRFSTFKIFIMNWIVDLDETFNKIIDQHVLLNDPFLLSKETNEDLADNMVDLSMEEYVKKYMARFYHQIKEASSSNFLLEMYLCGKFSVRLITSFYDYSPLVASNDNRKHFAIANDDLSGLYSNEFDFAIRNNRVHLVDSWFDVKSYFNSMASSTSRDFGATKSSSGLPSSSSSSKKSSSTSFKDKLNTKASFRPTYRIVSNHVEPFVIVSKLDEHLVTKDQCKDGLPCLDIESSEMFYSSPQTRSKDKKIDLAQEMKNIYNKELMIGLVKGFKYFDDERFQSNKTHFVKTKCCTGYIINLLQRLAHDLEFDFEFYFSPDKKYGQYNATTGDWVGSISHVINGIAHMAAGPYSMTEDRLKFVDFSMPFLYSGYSLLIKQEKKGVDDLFMFMKPFTYLHWGIILVFAGCSAFSLALLEFNSPFGLNPYGRQRARNYTLGSAISMVISLMFMHTMPAKSPKSWAGKWTQNFIASFALIFIATYTAQMASILSAGQDANKIYTGIDDDELLTKTRGFLYSSSIESHICRNHKAYYQSHCKNSVMVQNDSEALDRILNGTLDVFISDHILLNYLRFKQTNCAKLQLTGQDFATTGYALALNKNMNEKEKEQINIKILDYYETGYLDELYNQWFNKRMKCNTKGSDQKIRIDVEQYRGVYAYLGIGLIAAILVLLLEQALYKWTIPFLRSQPNKSMWKSFKLMFISQRFYRIVHSEELYDATHSAKEFINVFRRRDFEAIFQKSFRKKQLESLHGSQLRKRPKLWALIEASTERRSKDLNNMTPSFQSDENSEQLSDSHLKLPGRISRSRDNSLIERLSLRNMGRPVEKSPNRLSLPGNVLRASTKSESSASESIEIPIFINVPKAEDTSDQALEADPASTTLPSENQDPTQEASQSQDQSSSPTTDDTTDDSVMKTSDENNIRFESTNSDLDMSFRSEFNDTISDMAFSTDVATPALEEPEIFNICGSIASLRISSAKDSVVVMVTPGPSTSTSRRTIQSRSSTAENSNSNSNGDENSKASDQNETTTTPSGGVSPSSLPNESRSMKQYRKLQSLFANKN